MITPSLVLLLFAVSLALPSLATPFPPLLLSNSPLPLPLSSPSSPYPHHDLLPLNDGHLIPSPAFGVGSVLKQQNVTSWVLSAFEVGYRHVDNAAVYGTEEYVGAAIKAWGGRREELYVTSKFDHMRGRDARTELMESLRLLGLDYLDLYLIHSPRMVSDNQTAVWREFEAFKREGLVKSIGVSNYDPLTLLPLLSIATIPPAVNQIRYHVYNAASQAATLALCAANNITVEAYGALEPLKNPGGAGESAAEEAAEKLSGRWGREVNSGQAVLDWVRSRGLVAVTTSTKPWRQEENLAVFDEAFPKLTSDEIKQFEKAGAP